ncbi:MAG: addiction module toxin RelE, partial [Nitrospirota bacterium]|nr:addiction module toxin RelE [Nitrospirota bacterium]
MTRPLRIEYAGAVYHITSRGNERKAVFKSD